MTVFTVRVGEYNFSVIITIIINNNNIREIIRAGAATGLSLSVHKCELITHRDFHVNDVFLQLEDATLFRAPLLIAA